MGMYDLSGSGGMPRLGGDTSGFSSLGSYGFDGASMGSSPRGGGMFSAPQDAGFSLRNLLAGGFLDSTDPTTNIRTQGWGMPAIQVGQGLFNAYLGMKQYGLYKDQLAEGKRQFGLNYDAQKRTTNAALEDRQRARLASNPNAYESLAGYMSKNAIQGG